MKKFKNNKSGFTLVELLVVIAIIAILAAIIAPNAFKAIEKSKVSKIGGDCKTIENATLQHYADTGEWPRFNGAGDTNNRGLLGVDGYKPDKWNGPYIERWPKNPFNANQVSGQDNYQLDYRLMGTGNSEKNLVVEISLNGVAGYEKIRENLDKSVDGGDGLNQGKVQWVNNNPWITWIIVKNAEGVKLSNGNSFTAH